MSDPKADARLAILVLAAEQMYDAQGPKVLEPDLDPRVSADWDLRGYITGTDAICRALGRFALGECHVFYGLVLESRAKRGVFSIAIRGTAGTIEWVEDAQGLPTISHFDGLVESGFVGIYNTFMFRPPGGVDMPLIPALSALLIGAKATVAGHSLGSALATYLAYDLALKLPGRVALRIWASPHPGNSRFTTTAGALIPDHVHYRNVNDIVPNVPIALDYRHLPNTINMQPVSGGVEIKKNWGCSHHLLSYIALMDHEAMLAADSPMNQPYLGCIVNRITTT